MKELKPVTYKQFKCDFCNRIYKTNLGVNNHEDKCYKNPNRNCKTCNNTGIQITHEFDTSRGITTVLSKPIEVKSVCSSCEVASVNGGKSYIK